MDFLSPAVVNMADVADATDWRTGSMLKHTDIIVTPADFGAKALADHRQPCPADGLPITQAAAQVVHGEIGQISCNTFSGARFGIGRCYKCDPLTNDLIRHFNSLIF